MRKKPPHDPIRAYARRATATRRVGEGAECACGESRPEALLPGSKPIKCARCDREERGRATEDQHHPAGESNDLTTIPVPVNDHRARLSPDQYDWPRETLKNTDGSPIIAAAARNRGFVDIDAYLQEKLLIRNAEMFEVLDKYLVEKLGAKWWENTPLEQFAPRAKRDVVL